MDEDLDTWTPRDLPVLRHLVKRFDRDWEAQLSAPEIANETGRDVEDVRRALMALYSKTPPLIVPAELAEITLADRRKPYPVSGVTGDARAATGMWPSPESAADSMITALRRAIEHADDPEEKTKLQRLLDAAGSVGTSVLGGVLTAASTTGLGLS